MESQGDFARDFSDSMEANAESSENNPVIANICQNVKQSIKTTESSLQTKQSNPPPPSLRGSEATEAIHKDANTLENTESAELTQGFFKYRIRNNSSDKMDCLVPKGLRNDGIGDTFRICFLWIATKSCRLLAMTTLLYRHCEGNARSNPKNTTKLQKHKIHRINAIFLNNAESTQTAESLKQFHRIHAQI